MQGKLETWVSLAEAAELEEKPRQTIQNRMYSGKIRYRTEPNPEGGRDLVKIELSTLTPHAQSLYKSRLYQRIRCERAKQETANKTPPWYTTVDIGWYMSEYREEYFEKTALAGELDKYLEQKKLHHKSVTSFCEEFAREHLDISGKQMMRYIKRYLDAEMWAEIEEQKDGCNHRYFKILALCTPPKKGKNTKLDDRVRAMIENIWVSEEFLQNQQSMTLLLEKLRAQMQGEEWIPSYNTVKRYVDKLEARYSSEKVLVQKGASEWKNRKMMKRERDTGSLRVMDLWEGDAHTFDCWIQITNPNGTVTAQRPFIVAFMDVRSRCIAGWGICTQPNAEVIKHVLIHALYPKECSPVMGVPRVILIDNGKDFTAETLTGRKRTERFSIDGEIKGFYRAIGIEDDMRALPYQGWSKGHIERFFGDVCERFSKTMNSYTGTLTGSKTDAKIKKDIAGMLKRGELFTLDEFTAMFETFLERYHEKEHEGLKKQGEENPRPARVYETADRYKKPAPPIEYALSLLGTAVVRTVYNTGIELNKRRYMSEDLAAYIGEKVTVRVKEYGADTIICYDSEGHLIGNAYTYEKLDPIAEDGDDILTEHLKSQKRQLRNTRMNIASLKMPHSERQIALPKLTGEDAKTVSMPQDMQYAELVRSRKVLKEPEKKEEPGLNDYMREQARRAIERIEKLG